MYDNDNMKNEIIKKKIDLSAVDWNAANIFQKIFKVKAKDYIIVFDDDMQIPSELNTTTTITILLAWLF